jgi:hypothetical protein
VAIRKHPPHKITPLGCFLVDLMSCFLMEVVKNIVIIKKHPLPLSHSNQTRSIRVWFIKIFYILIKLIWTTVTGQHIILGTYNFTNFNIISYKLIFRIELVFFASISVSFVCNWDVLLQLLLFANFYLSTLFAFWWQNVTFVFFDLQNLLDFERAQQQSSSRLTKAYPLYFLFLSFFKVAWRLCTQISFIFFSK